MARKWDARSPAAQVKQTVISPITICCKNAEIAAILHDTKNCNFAVIAAMTADFAVQNSLYIIAKTATAILSPHAAAHHYPQCKTAARLHEGRAAARGAPRQPGTETNPCQAPRPSGTPRAGKAHPRRPSGASAGQVVLPCRGPQKRQLAHRKAGHRQSGKGPQGRNDPPALLGR